MGVHLLTLAAGALLGVVTSLVAWWLGASGLAPRIEFGPHISKISNPGEQMSYRIKFKPRRRRWLRSDVVDVEVAARLLVTGLSRHAPGNQIAIEIPVRRSRIIVMPSNHIARLQLERIRDVDLLPADLRSTVADGSIELETLFALGSRARLRIYVSAADGLMRARRVSVMTYEATDIRNGRFEKNGLDVVPARLDEVELPSLPHAAIGVASPDDSKRE
jgi:hypothetical protein